jgi:hypothetical protein
MDMESLLTEISDPGLRDQFQKFVNSGEATDEFLDLLDENPRYQRIIDRAFETQAAKFEQFAASLREVEPALATGMGQPDSLSSEFVRNVREVAKLPTEDLEVFTAKTASAVPANQRERVTSVMSKLSQAMRA